MRSPLKSVRRKLTAVLAAVIVTAAAVTITQVATADVSASSTKLKVMNWNINGKGADLGAIAKKIKDMDINVLTVQEIHRGTIEGDQVMSLVKRLGWYTDNVPNVHFSQADKPGTCDDEGEGWVGNAIMSKYPIGKKYTVPLAPKSQDCPVKRVLTGANLDLPGNDYLRVWTSHFTPGKNQGAKDHRDAQASKVLKTLTFDGPMLFTGDVNEKPGGIQSSFVDKGWLDTGKEFGSEATHHKARIDYIFSKKVKVTDGDVTDTKLSDHRPIVMTMKVA